MEVYWNSGPLQGKLTPDGGDVLAHSTITGMPAGKVERCWDALHPGPPYLSGGPFSKIVVETPNYVVQGSGSYELGPYDEYNLKNIRYVGGFCNPYWEQNEWAPDLAGAINDFAPGVVSDRFNPDDLRSRGNSAYNKLRPKVSMGSIGQAIAEFRDVPDTLKSTGNAFASIWQRISTSRNASWRRKEWLQASKGASDQFVNTQFGWLPFVRDVYDVCKNVVNNHESIARLKAKNNKWQMRTFREQSISRETELATWGFIGCEPADSLYFRRIVSSFQPYTLSVQEFEDVWYKGVFKYYYPEFDDSSWMAGFPSIQKVIQQIDLFGGRVDPVLLYKVTPWTWLADWFTDIGDGIQRLQDIATDSTVSKYFYVMRHRTWRVRTRARFSALGNHDYSWYYGGEVKIRESGDSPFGFNLKPVNLTGLQWSILGALGLSHLL
jgi:hypothetical protein